MPQDLDQEIREGKSTGSAIVIYLIVIYGMPERLRCRTIQKQKWTSSIMQLMSAGIARLKKNSFPFYPA